MRVLYFFLASGVGAATRYLITSQFRRLFSFPLGVLIVNTFGSFLLGLVIGESTDLAFAIIGFCGALTTWSTFALDLDKARRQESRKEFFLNIALNYGLAIAAMLAGLWVSG